MKNFYICGRNNFVMKTNAQRSYKSKERATPVAEPAVAYGSPSLNHFIIKDDYSLVKKARNGVDTRVFYSLAETIKMPEKTLASVINLSPRTISNYRDQNKDLDAN